MRKSLYFHIQRVFRYLKRLVTYKNYYYDILQQFSNDLEPGEYRLFWDKVRFFWMKANKTQWQNILSHYSLKAKVKVLFTKHYAEVCPSTVATLGTELVISRRHTSVKIVNRVQNEITTYYLHREDFDVTYSFWKEFAPSFGTTTIFLIDPKQLNVTETLISEKDSWRSDDIIKHNCICWFMEGLLEYCNTTSPVCFETAEKIIQKINSYDLSRSIEKAALIEVVGLLTNGIAGVEKDELPCINSHCDLSFFNILYDGEKFYLIDWEYYHTNLFCFDSLYWMSYEAMVNNDYSFFDEYFAGKYDDWLEQIFNASGIPYYKEKRRSYIYLLLLAELEMHLFYSEMGSVRSYGDFVKVIHYLENQKG